MTIKRIISPLLSLVLYDGTIKLYFEVVKSGLEGDISTLHHSQVNNFFIF